MILIYVFMAFLFYKIYPAAVAMPGNTVIGAALMAVCSGAVLVAAEVLAIRLYLRWHMAALASDEVNFLPFGAGAAVIGGGILAALSCAPIAVGFSSRLARWGVRHPEDFWLMAAIPPAAYALVKFWELLKGVRATEAQRQIIRDTDRDQP